MRPMMNRGHTRPSTPACLLALLTLLTLVAVSLAGLPSVALGQADRSVVWDEIDVTVELR